MEKWEEVLESLYKEYNIKFNVFNFSNIPYEWVCYGTQEYNDYISTHKFVNHRQVMPDEIIIDIDIDNDDDISIKRTKTTLFANKIEERICMLGLKGKRYISGGVGTHFHFRFIELFKYNKMDRDILKKEIVKYICRGFFFNFIDGKWVRVHKDEPHVCADAKVTISIEYSPHRKGGVKELIRDYDSENYRENKIHNTVFEKLIKTKEKIKKLQSQNNPNERPMWVDVLENEDFHNFLDGRKRACFALACYYYKFYNDRNKTINHLIEWNSKVLNMYLTKSFIYSNVRTLKDGRPLPYRYVQSLLDDLGYDHT